MRLINHEYISYLALIAPIFCAAIALRGGRWVLRCGVDITCIIIIAAFGADVPGSWILTAALIISMAGDFMLCHRESSNQRFVYGIILFLAAHVLYLVFCCINGSVNWAVFVVLLAGYGILYIRLLLPAIESKPLAAAAAGYLLISCLSMGAAAGLGLTRPAAWLFAIGIASLVFSDSLIAVREFLNKGLFLHRYIMMPTYYASHILITAAIVSAAIN
jgi:uncharacterized membrane protein YhhN